MAINDVFSIIASAFSAPIAWFTSLLSAISGSEGVILAAFFMSMLIVFFISPIRGGGLSDRASKRNGSGKNSSGGDE